MCRRRIIAIFLSLALVASCFVTNVFAEESEYANVKLVYNNTVQNIEIAVEEGTGFSFSLASGEEYTLDIRSLYAQNNSIPANTSIAVNFSMRLYVFYSSYNYDHNMSSANIRRISGNSYNNSNSGLFKWISYYDYDYTFEPDRYNRSPYGFQGSFILNNNVSSHNVNTSIVLHNYSQTTVTCLLFLEHVSISSDINWFLSYIFNPVLNSISNSLDLQNTKLFNDLFSYYEIEYDEDGNSTVTEKSGNWITAVWGAINSLVAPVKNQVEQEQMARDAGFEDVLDDAYDKSNPGSFLDLLDIGDLADWNEQSFSGSLSDGFLYWFSQSCADDIDTVPVVRGQEPQVIDFYTQHMNDYWEALTDGTADQGGD